MAKVDDDADALAAALKEAFWSNESSSYRMYPPQLPRSPTPKDGVADGADLDEGVGDHETCGRKCGAHRDSRPTGGETKDEIKKESDAPADEGAQWTGSETNDESKDESDAPAEEGAQQQLPLPPDLVNAPRIAAEHEERERAALSEKERSEVLADVYGRRPPDEIRLEEGMDALERELGRIPPDRKRALLRAQRAFPFLVSTPHAKLFLNAEDFDPPRAARRMVRYWEKREQLYGDGAFSFDSFNLPSEEDIIRISSKRNHPTLDPNVDKEVSQIAEEYLRDWQAEKSAAVDRELEKIPARDKAALVDAQETRPDLAATGAHKAIFLRSVDYDPRRAARRMANYWDMKYYLFGKERAFNPVTLNELEDCNAELLEGIFHLLPGTDAFGRGLICLRVDKLPSDRSALKRVLKVVWYTLHAALAKESTWNRGLVLIVVAKSINIKQLSFEFGARMASMLFDGIPLQFRASHDCMPPASPWFRFVLPVFRHLIGRKARARVVVHNGTEEEVLAGLGGCGISSEQLPCVLGGTLDPNFVLAWVEEQRAQSM